ncbi:helix-turn-helix domain-containing protein [Gluconobacter cerinus]|uniref:helix-turn-helix domain-containing protein n=1 Tax=Gluconobacter cerinus TaxID=38307 RepID=UPI00207B42DB|nr:helix-turn-helix transcriptional regulator [Gluconobacter cerinus]
MKRLFGKNFARLRQEKGLTQEQVEERSGFSQQYLSGLERGHRNPTVVTLYELAQALETTPVEFLKPDLTVPTEMEHGNDSSFLR